MLDDTNTRPWIQDHGNWSYIGCFHDNEGSRDLDGATYQVASTTVAAANECMVLCAGFAYFGLQWVNECFCGNSYGAQGEHTNSSCGDVWCEGGCGPDPRNNTLCGNGEQNCGNRNAIYSIYPSPILDNITTPGRGLDHAVGPAIRGSRHAWVGPFSVCTGIEPPPLAPPPPPPPTPTLHVTREYNASVPAPWDLGNASGNAGSNASGSSGQSWSVPAEPTGGNASCPTLVLGNITGNITGGDRSNGEVYCEGGRFTSSNECDASDCCQWDGACHSAVGAGACPSGGGSGVEAAGSPGGFITGLNYTVVDIAITGTAITTWQQGSDDGWFEIGLPFIFPWYGNAECAVHIGTNGYLTFGTAHFSGAHTEPFPGSPAGPVDGVIGVFWADINPGASSAGGVFYQAFGACGRACACCYPALTVENASN